MYEYITTVASFKISIEGVKFLPKRVFYKKNSSFRSQTHNIMFLFIHITHAIPTFMLIIPNNYT